MSLKAKIEAILFLTEKPLRAQAIAGIVGEEVQLVRQSLLELIHDYEERQGGLEIADEDGYSFQVRDQYANMMDEFLPIEMSAAQLRTLSAIAIKQPIPQSEIIRIRGAGAYDHIKELVLRGLISKREDEKTRSPLLSTTKQFQEYFRLTKDGKSLRSYLKREMKKKDKVDDLAGVVGQGAEGDTNIAAEHDATAAAALETNEVVALADTELAATVESDEVVAIADTELAGAIDTNIKDKVNDLSFEPAEAPVLKQELNADVVIKSTAEPEAVHTDLASADADLESNAAKTDLPPNSVPDSLVSTAAFQATLASSSKESLPEIEIFSDKDVSDPLPRITLEQHNYEIQVPLEASDSNNENLD